MPILEIPGFKGGLASNLFDSLDSQTYQTARDLDIFTNPNILRPTIALANDAGCTTTNALCNIIKVQSTYYATGDDGSSKLRLFSSAALSNNTTWATVATSGTASTSPSANRTANHLVYFQDYLFFNAYTAGKVSQYGTVVGGGNTYTEAWATLGGSDGPIIVHEGLKKLIISRGNKAWTWTSGAVPTSGNPALTLDNKYIIRSLAPMGAFVLVGADDPSGSTTSKVFIWDGTAATVSDVIDVGDSGLRVVRNSNGVVYIWTVQYVGATPLIYSYRLYQSSGGQVRLVRELPVNATNTTSGGDSLLMMDTAADAFQDKVFFGFAGAATANPIGIDNLVYAYGTGNASPQRAYTPYRVNSAATLSNIQYLLVRVLESDLVIVWRNNASSTWKMDHTQAYAASTSFGTLSANGVYQSNGFYFDPVYKGKINKIEIRHKPLPASTGFRVSVNEIGKYSDGGTPPALGTFTQNGTGALVALSQTTANSTRTIINSINGAPFSLCDGAQIQIEFNTVSGKNGAEIIFPILIDYDTNKQLTR